MTDVQVPDLGPLQQEGPPSYATVSGDPQGDLTDQRKLACHRSVEEEEDEEDPEHSGRKGGAGQGEPAGGDPLDASAKDRRSCTESAIELGRESRAQRRDSGAGFLADDEEEDEEDVAERRSQLHWMPGRSVEAFTPKVTILHPSVKQPTPQGFMDYREVTVASAPLYQPQGHAAQPERCAQQWTNEVDKPRGSSEALKLSLSMAAAALIFPLLVWAGYELLPFEPPPLSHPALRLMYTLRCAFFASIPVVLGALVHGVSLLRFGALNSGSRQVVIHWHYVRDSMSVFLLFFLQLAMLSTYLQQDMLKLVPLLTIVFAFGRMIYWVCLSFESSVRGLGYGLSFLPVLAMLGANFYYVGSSTGGLDSVFDVAQPTTPPPPRLKWWG
ncbi:transmembrane protein 79 [Denticeps clupeoides]|uniref:Transmembrane protein 79 n=1 Tax=Denticeps clupeoides TaxID=299321 RepID=A0AAY4D5W8_9TELE|nr:transmembrane protein 79-like [Denticeps clupeoides]